MARDNDFLFDSTVKSYIFNWCDSNPAKEKRRTDSGAAAGPERWTRAKQRSVSSTHFKEVRNACEVWIGDKQQQPLDNFSYLCKREHWMFSNWCKSEVSFTDILKRHKWVRCTLFSKSSAEHCMNHNLSLRSEKHFSSLWGTVRLYFGKSQHAVWAFRGVFKPSKKDFHHLWLREYFLFWSFFIFDQCINTVWLAKMYYLRDVNKRAQLSWYTIKLLWFWLIA